MGYDMEGILKKAQAITPCRKVGLIVNPIAGMGGRVGLKGTDGQEIVKKAMELGAEPVSPIRTIEALERIGQIVHPGEIELITYPFEMGEDEAKQCGFNPKVVGSIIRGQTTAVDTKNAAMEMLKLKVDLLLFAGGDGTARDICEAVGLKVPVLGIPTGVKIHSGVFAINPKKAGELTIKFLRNETELRAAEVMDIDEEAFRKGRVAARVYGYLLVPFERRLLQEAKSSTPAILEEKRNQEEIAEYVIENMEDDYYYVLGSGTTVKAIADKLGIEKTLLGVDVVHKGKIVAMDLNEEQLLKIIEEAKKVKIIVSPIGGQGFIFGRGNLQISPEVLRKIGKDNVIVIVTKNKLSSIGWGRPLLVDTGDEQVNKMFAGYFRVITGYNEEAIIRVES